MLDEDITSGHVFLPPHPVATIPGPILAATPLITHVHTSSLPPLSGHLSLHCDNKATTDINGMEFIKLWGNGGTFTFMAILGCIRNHACLTLYSILHQHCVNAILTSKVCLAC